MAGTRSIRVAGLAGALVMGVLTGSGTPMMAQEGACQLVATAEVSAIVGATLPEGAPFETTCYWGTETLEGELVAATVELDMELVDDVVARLPGGEHRDIAGMPAYLVLEETDEGRRGIGAADVPEHPVVVTVESTDEEMDVLGMAGTLLDLVVGRLLSGEAAPTATASPAGARPGACELLSEVEVEGAMQLDLTALPGSADLCGWISEEPGRSLVTVTLDFQPGGMARIRTMFPDGTDAAVAGLPAYHYGFEAGDTRIAYISAEAGAEVATIQVGHDDPALDPDAIAADLLTLALERAGLAGSPDPADPSASGPPA